MWQLRKLATRCPQQYQRQGSAVCLLSSLFLSIQSRIPFQRSGTLLVGPPYSVKHLEMPAHIPGDMLSMEINLCFSISDPQLILIKGKKGRESGREADKEETHINKEWECQCTRSVGALDWQDGGPQHLPCVTSLPCVPLQALKASYRFSSFRASLILSVSIADRQPAHYRLI